MRDDERERLGKIVRSTWIAWAATQPDVAKHPTWLLPWDEIDERDREVDRAIGEAVATAVAPRTTIPTELLGRHYNARRARDDESGMTRADYYRHGPGTHVVTLRLRDHAQVCAVLDALDDAYDAGHDDTVADVRRVLGL